MCFDRDSPFAFQIHGIEQLILFLALMDRAGPLEQSIRQGGLSVIDVRDDAEIARVLDSHEARNYAGARKVAQAPRLFFELRLSSEPAAGLAACRAGAPAYQIVERFRKTPSSIRPPTPLPRKLMRSPAERPIHQPVQVGNRHTCPTILNRCRN